MDLEMMYIKENFVFRFNYVKILAFELYLREIVDLKGIIFALAILKL